jgi:hypothetical protein
VTGWKRLSYALQAILCHEFTSLPPAVAAGALTNIGI